MSFSRLLPLLLLPAIAKAAPAQEDGAQLYSLYCSACHGVDGKGANDGAFPPLAGSEWIVGNPKRSVAIVLHGLQGPVEVNGKTYDLAMPPQGAALSDNQIRAILNHVHSSWGNKGQEIPGDLIRTVRAEFESRETAWTAKELLKLFPLEKKETALANLTSRTYKGQWNQLPDFNKIQAENIEEEHNGIIDTAVAAEKVNFGIVWEGDFMAATGGVHEFRLDADDGARLIIAGKAVVEVNGLGPMNGTRAKNGKAPLEQGANHIRVEYFQGGGHQGITLGWKGPKSKQWEWLTPAPESTGNKGIPAIPLIPASDKTVIYRNFIAGTTPRAIGFGFPGGVNLAYSADNLAPELVWAGDFIDASRHWTGRGQGNQQPSGDNVLTLTKARYLPKDARFKGYSLDKRGNPTFNVSIGAATLADAWKPGETGTLIRSLTLSGGSPIEIPLGNADVTGAEKLTLTPGQPATIIYTLR
ncbi:c-type cytochrome [Akkermansiaceae bacterium]|nr:c-type cytochrome [Akkermansiaceae bacterium]